MTFSLFTIIEPSIRNHPERTAIVTEWGRRISYRQLAEMIDSFAVRAVRAGILKGDHIALDLKEYTAYLCAIFALSKLGAVPALYSGSLAATGLRIDYTIVGPVSASTVSNVIRMDSGWFHSSAAALQMPMAGFDTNEDIALIMFTSGTTDDRKSLGFSLALINQDLADRSSLWGPLCGRTLLRIPPIAVFGLKLAFLILKSGGQIIWSVLPPRDELSLLLQGDVDNIIAPPLAYSHWVELLKINGIKLSSIKRAIIGGSVASTSLLKSVQEHICRDLINHYGSSELGPCASSNVDDVASIPDAVGKIAPWLDVRISDNHGTELPRGETGLLQFRMKPGRQIARYINTAARTINTADGWFIPGDMGTLTEDGILCIQGRQSDLINIGGNKVASSTIEEFVNRFLGETAMACVFGLPGASGFDEVIVAVDARNMPRLEGLQTYISAAPKRWGRIRIMTVDAFPLNEFGKVDKNKLREIAAASTRA